jgi:hypothetical protein
LGIALTAGATEDPRLRKPTLWPSKDNVIQIPYEVQDTRSDIVAAVDKAASVWNSTGQIHFYKVRPPASVACGRMVVVMYHPDFPSEPLCGATGGYRGQDNKDNLLVTNICGTLSPLLSDFVHELGHTAGLMHEHQRRDRDSFVTLSALPSGTTYKDHAQLNYVEEVGFTQTHVYGYLSVMHYPLRAPNGIDVTKLWENAPPEHLAIFELNRDQDALFKKFNPSASQSDIGHGSGKAIPLTDIQALRNLYTDPFAARAKLNDVCQEANAGP